MQSRGRRSSVTPRGVVFSLGIGLGMLPACAAISGLNQLLYDRDGAAGGEGTGGQVGDTASSSASSSSASSSSASSSTSASSSSVSSTSASSSSASSTSASSSSASSTSASSSGASSSSGGVVGTNVAEICNPGDYAVGVSVRAGAWIDQFSLVCAHINADESVGSQTYKVGGVGGSGGNPRDLVCPAGQVVVQWQVTTGMAIGNVPVVLSFAIGCQTPAAYKTSTDVNPILGPVGGASTVGPATFTCPQALVFGNIHVDTTPDGQYVQSLHDGFCYTYP